MIETDGARLARLQAQLERENPADRELIVTSRADFEWLLAGRSAGVGSLRGLIASLPRYQLHVQLSTLTPFVEPFNSDPNETGAFIKADELESALSALNAQPEPPEVCICAAVQFADGRIVRGHRHDACFRTAVGWTPKPTTDGHVQGFVTSHNRFVGREEGAALQNAAGIVSAMTGKPIRVMLFSEDLYFEPWERASPPTEEPKP